MKYQFVERKFTKGISLDESVLNNGKLSFTALGLYMYLLFERTKEITHSDIMLYSLHETREQMNDAILQLIKEGYLEELI